MCPSNLGDGRRMDCAIRCLACQAPGVGLYLLRAMSDGPSAIGGVICRLRKWFSSHVAGIMRIFIREKCHDHASMATFHIPELDRPERLRDDAKRSTAADNFQVITVFSSCGTMSTTVTVRRAQRQHSTCVHTKTIHFRSENTVAAGTNVCGILPYSTSFKVLIAITAACSWSASEPRCCSLHACGTE